MLAARSARSACTPLTSFVMKRNFASRGNRGNFDSNTSKVAKVDSRNGPPVSLIAPPSTFAPETALTYDEPALGISAYLRVGIPFTGIIKSRFADFQVHEIDATGRVVQLTNVDVPAEELAASKAASEEAAKHKAMMNSTEQIDISAVVSDLVSICGQDAAQGFSMWFQAAQAFRIAASAQNATPAADADASGAAATPALQAPSESFSFPASLDKAARTALHTTFKANLQMLISDFKDGAVIVRFLRKNERAQVRGNRNAPEASKLATDLSSKFLQFVLYKENRDTMTAVSALARAMHTRAKSFSYAGTKDKRGQTTQLITCTARGMSARHVLAATRYDEMRAGNFQYVTDALRLGSLQGNRFTIVLRDVKLLSGDLSSMEDSINAAAESVRTKGFINYFGLQRFGTSTISTHRIGRALLCRDYALAIYLILAPRGTERPEVVEWRERLMNKPRDIGSALAASPPYAHAEQALLNALFSRTRQQYFSRGGSSQSTSPLMSTDLLGALGTLPRQQLHLYLHAYQSYIFNHACTHRLTRMNATQPVEGDLVLLDNSAEDIVADDEVANVDDGSDRESTPEAEEQESNSTRQRVRVLSAADIASGQYSITDIVLPLIGSGSVMPANEVSGVMQELLKADGLSLHELSDSAGVRFLSLPGGYRKLVTKPSDLTCRFTRYSDPTRALTVSDVELLRNPAAEPAPFEENGQYAAVVLQFSLSSSCYATMLLRELMMSSTEKHHHAALLAKHMDSVDAVNVSAADVHKRNSPAPQL